ncbi:DUF1244 domain-containing protein [Ewingella americana]|nr:DUF1244 domain-containing protein [Ewingella americana]MRT05007.1 DUF1244 domain-containing protein [Ewingella americana]QMV53680.1 DUF1244 domain-containing protein [Ewingella americana]
MWGVAGFCINCLAQWM